MWATSLPSPTSDSPKKKSAAMSTHSSIRKRVVQTRGVYHHVVRAFYLLASWFVFRAKVEHEPEPEHELRSQKREV
jgi:hypothetical protein